MPADPSSIIAAARQRHELTRAKAVKALRELDRTGAPVTFQAVAAAARVSRSWLYAAGADNVVRPGHDLFDQRNEILSWSTSYRASDR
jgi:hypothetical protein